MQGPSKPSTKSGEVHTEEEWEKIRIVFIKLYLTQGRPLSEVRKFIAKNYGFYATPRQYKNRIIKWDAYKKDARGSQSSRQSTALSTVVKKEEVLPALPRGQLVVPLRQGHHITLNTRPLTRTLNPPGHLGAVQVALYGVNRYYLGVLVGNDVDAVQVRAQADEWNIRQFFDTANVLSALAAGSRWDKAQDMYGQLLQFAAPLLRERNPIVVVCLLQICSRFLQDGQEAVLQRFLSFVSRLAATQQLDTHPLSLMSSAWNESGEHMMDLVTLCSSEALDILGDTLGPEHPQTLSAVRGLSTALYVKGDSNAALRAMLSVAETEQKLYPGTYMEYDLHHRMAKCQLAAYNLESAANLIDQMDAVVDKIEGTGGRSEQVRRMRLDVLLARGELLRLQRDPKCLMYLEEALEQARAGAEIRDIWVLRFVERHLALAKETLNDASRPVPVSFPC
ncbi:hypothetical protein GQ53DRAFT_822378 [Thozetella sp. PMI_491]|nr:hypothetical protein GQ53DRAFT_822378 [Thozetella sp. PMI_491]